MNMTSWSRPPIDETELQKQFAPGMQDYTMVATFQFFSNSSIGGVYYVELLNLIGAIF